MFTRGYHDRSLPLTSGFSAQVRCPGGARLDSESPDLGRQRSAADLRAVPGSSAGAAAGCGDPGVPKGEGWRWVWLSFLYIYIYMGPQIDLEKNFL